MASLGQRSNSAGGGLFGGGNIGTGGTGGGGLFGGPSKTTGGGGGGLFGQGGNPAPQGQAGGGLFGGGGNKPGETGGLFGGGTQGGQPMGGGGLFGGGTATGGQPTGGGGLFGGGTGGGTSGGGLFGGGTTTTGGGGLFGGGTGGGGGLFGGTTQSQTGGGLFGSGASTGGGGLFGSGGGQGGQLGGPGQQARPQVTREFYSGTLFNNPTGGAGFSVLSAKPAPEIKTGPQSRFAGSSKGVSGKQTLNKSSLGKTGGTVVQEGEKQVLNVDQEELEKFKFLTTISSLDGFLSEMTSKSPMFQKPVSAYKELENQIVHIDKLISAQDAKLKEIKTNTINLSQGLSDKLKIDLDQTFLKMKSINFRVKQLRSKVISLDDTITFFRRVTQDFKAYYDNVSLDRPQRVCFPAAEIQSLTGYFYHCLGAATKCIDELMELVNPEEEECGQQSCLAEFGEIIPSLFKYVLSICWKAEILKSDLQTLKYNLMPQTRTFQEPMQEENFDFVNKRLGDMDELFGLK